MGRVHCFRLLNKAVPTDYFRGYIIFAVRCLKRLFCCLIACFLLFFIFYKVAATATVISDHKNEFVQILKPVSYTHLDVYKRQFLGNLVINIFNLRGF